MTTTARCTECEKHIVLAVAQPLNSKREFVCNECAGPDAECELTELPVQYCAHCKQIAEFVTIPTTWSTGVTQ